MIDSARGPLRPNLIGTVMRALRRDLRDRHVVVIGLAVILAAASVTAVDMFTSRVRAALAAQSSALLAGDLAIAGNDPLPAAYERQARSLGLQVAQHQTLRSVVSSGDALQLVELKAVSSGYPLRGELRLADSPFSTGSAARTIPAQGSVWVEARLLDALGIAVGDQISIGELTLSIAKVLVLEPDRSGDLFNIAPRVLMNSDDLAATQLIMPGSRVRYTLLVAGTRERLQAFRTSILPRDGDRVLSPESARPEIRSALERAEQFLGLAAFTPWSLRRGYSARRV